MEILNSKIKTLNQPVFWVFGGVYTAEQWGDFFFFQTEGISVLETIQTIFSLWDFIPNCEELI